MGRRTAGSTRWTSRRVFSGVTKEPLRLPPIVRVTQRHLFEPVKTFGQPYWAVPDDDEFECTYNPDGVPVVGTVVAEGSSSAAGQNLEADVEGMTLYHPFSFGERVLRSSERSGLRGQVS